MDLMINLNACHRAGDEIEKQKKLIGASVTELESVINDLKIIDDTAIQMLVAKLKKRKQELLEDIRKLNSLSVALEQIIHQYEKTESRIEDFSATRVSGNVYMGNHTADTVYLPESEIITKYFS